MQHIIEHEKNQLDCAFGNLIETFETSTLDQQKKLRTDFFVRLHNNEFKQCLFQFIVYVVKFVGVDNLTKEESSTYLWWLFKMIDDETYSKSQNFARDFENIDEVICVIKTFDTNILIQQYRNIIELKCWKNIGKHNRIKLCREVYNIETNSEYFMIMKSVATTAFLNESVDIVEFLLSLSRYYYIRASFSDNSMQKLLEIAISNNDSKYYVLYFKCNVYLNIRGSYLGSSHINEEFDNYPRFKNSKVYQKICSQMINKIYECRLFEQLNIFETEPYSQLEILYLDTDDETKQIVAQKMESSDNFEFSLYAHKCKLNVAIPEKYRKMIQIIDEGET